MASDRECQVCGGAPESTVHLGIDPHGHRYRNDLACVADTSCEPGDHSLTWPCDLAEGF